MPRLFGTKIGKTLYTSNAKQKELIFNVSYIHPGKNNTNYLGITQYPPTKLHQITGTIKKIVEILQKYRTAKSSNFFHILTSDLSSQGHS